MNTIEELDNLIKQSRIISNLPEEVIDDEIKVDDWVICNKERKLTGEESSGWESELIFRVDSITHGCVDKDSYKDNIYWGRETNGNCGVWGRDLTKTYSRD